MGSNLNLLLSPDMLPIPAAELFVAGRHIVESVEQRQKRDVEEKNRQLAANVAKATLEHIVSTVRQDLEVLKSHMPTKESEALEASLDAKYLKDRQQSPASIDC